MLSWMDDDNCVVEEDGSASNHDVVVNKTLVSLYDKCLVLAYGLNFQPGFLSLDLNALETMLEKVEVHERLYIEADLLLPELVFLLDLNH